MASDPFTGQPEALCALLVAAAEHGVEPSTLALAGVISRWRQRPDPYDQPIAGLGRGAFLRLLQVTFPGLPGSARLALSGLQKPLSQEARFDEFDDLVALLGDHRSAEGEISHWLARAIATASMADDHLWQDMGLPNRAVLNALLREHFTTLYLKNVGDMKWKKFFYKRLCDRAEVPICKAPSCAICVDFRHCFGAEDKPEPGWALEKIPEHVAGA